VLALPILCTPAWWSDFKPENVRYTSVKYYLFGGAGKTRKEEGERRSRQLHQLWHSTTWRVTISWLWIPRSDFGPHVEVFADCGPISDRLQTRTEFTYISMVIWHSWLRIRIFFVSLPLQSTMMEQWWFDSTISMWSTNWNMKHYTQILLIRALRIDCCCRN
jgi:hypothetical protein